MWLIAAFLLEASARDALGEREAAGRALERGLDLAGPDGLLFPFLLHPVPELLERHAGQRTAHAALIRKIIGVLGGRTPLAPAAGPPTPAAPAAGPPTPAAPAAGPPTPAAPAAGPPTPAAPPAGPPEHLPKPLSQPEHLPEPLSEAEARVLRFLPTSLSAPEIARELYVSVNTIRTHMRHLYDKLGARRRLEAIDRARTLGLLAPVPQRALSQTRHAPIAPSQAVPLAPSQAVPLAPSHAVPLVPSEAVPLVPSEAVPLVPSEAVPLVPSEAVPLVPSEAVPLTPSQAVPPRRRAARRPPRRRHAAP